VLDRGLIGTRGSPRRFHVEHGALRFFSQTIGETNPVYFDEAAARAAGHRSILAPPTFAACFAAWAPCDRTSVQALRLPWDNLLHGEQVFTYHRPMYAGDAVTVISEIEDIYLRKGGALECLVIRGSVCRDGGELLIEARGILLIRHG